MTLILLSLLLSFGLIEGGKTGILYEGWHVQASTAYRKIAAMGGQPLTVEKVIRSNGGLTMNDILNKYNMQGPAANFYYQVEPDQGYYCIWRARPNDLNPPFPDCVNITQTLTRHAQQLTDAEIDFVAVDSTNIPTDQSEGDWLQLRPIEVLFEEWAILRAQGIKTPQIAVWPTIPPGATLWQNYVNMYHNSSYTDLLFRDDQGRPVMFVVPANADPNIINAIQSSGIVVVEMWAAISQSQISSGMWTFFSECNNNGQQQTSSIVGTQCNNYCTTNSPIGTQCSTSPSFQVMYTSLPMQSPGRLAGLTMKDQMVSILANQPDYLFFSSWNEFISQPQSNPFGSIANGFSMGLPNDPLRNMLFVDTYGSEYGRDIEPTIEYGTYFYDLMRSCNRVYKSGARSCSQSSQEECCRPSPGFVNVYSLAANSGDDFLLSNNPAEVNGLVNSGGWTEICNPFSGSSVFCYDAGNANGQYSSFIMFADEIPNSRPLYRCRAGNTHFFSPDPKCEGQVTEYLLGYMSNARSGFSARGLYRCRNPGNSAHFSSLDLACPPGQNDAGLLGYVR